LRQQDQLQRDELAFGQRLFAGKADAAFGKHNRLRRALILQQILRQCLSQQFDSLVLYLEIVGQGAVALGNLA
jgi:hypothetical protein